MSPNRIALDCDFIAGKYGDIFVTWTRPAREADILGSVMFLPPFGEEMNKSRRMIARQARAFARKGYAVLVVDLPGCGDSYGEFADASWPQWLDELEVCLAWLRQKTPVPVYLWACRMGALLACDLASRSSAEIAGLLFWQPVSDGRSIVASFLRLALAAEMTQTRAGQPTAAQLREELAGGGTVEIAGYELNGALASALEAVSLRNFECPHKNVAWLEVSRRAEPKISPASLRVIEQWQAHGAVVNAEVVAGDAFWNTVEIMEAPALIERTCVLLGEQAQ